MRRNPTPSRSLRVLATGFRKDCSYRFRGYPFGNTKFPPIARTCFEGPFGEVIRATGPMAKANPFRFSTKYQDDETDLLYYGYRYYNPSTGRWISTDPIGEKGGKNLYGLLRNAAVDKIDVLGKGDFEWQEPKEYDGGKPGGPGSTWWDPFSPEALVYSPNGCCFRVRLNGGQARPWILYNQGQQFGENTLQHERDHVRLHFRPAYDDYKSAAAALGAPCMGKGRAMCLKSVIESELSAEYQARTFRDGAAYDWTDYGASNPDPDVQQQARDNMQGTAKDYQQAKKATAAAIAACPSE